MDWLLIIVSIGVIWLLSDIGNKLHAVQKDVEMIKNQLQRKEDQRDD